MSLKPIVGAVAIALSLSLVAAVPAEAATSKVSIAKIATQKVAYKKSATVRPIVKQYGQVKISSKKLTVKKGKKTVVKNKTTAKLKAGSYKVTTNVKYRVYSYKNKKTVAVKKGHRVFVDYLTYGNRPTLSSCKVTAVYGEDDYAATCRLTKTTTTPVRVRSSKISGVDYTPDACDTIHPDSIVAPKDIYVNTKVRAYGKVRSATRTQTLKVKQAPKPRGCARKSDFNKVESGQTKARVTQLMGSSGKQYFYSYPYEGREYKACDSDQYMSVSFDAGYVDDKLFYDFG